VGNFVAAVGENSMAIDSQRSSSVWMLGIGTPNGAGRGPKVASVGADGLSASGFLLEEIPPSIRATRHRPGAIRVDIA
jgi:hypothetical protein